MLARELFPGACSSEPCSTPAQQGHTVLQCMQTQTPHHTTTTHPQHPAAITITVGVITGNYSPTPTHHFLRLLHDKGLLLRCFTQNIDSLERQARAAAGQQGSSSGRSYLRRQSRGVGGGYVRECEEALTHMLHTHTHTHAAPLLLLPLHTTGWAANISGSGRTRQL